MKRPKSIINVIYYGTSTYKSEYLVLIPMINLKNWKGWHPRKHYILETKQRIQNRNTELENIINLQVKN